MAASVGDPMSQYQLLSGKTVLVIGASHMTTDRRFIWKTFQDLNAKVILINAECDSHGYGHVEHFIQYNFIKNEIKDDERHATNIIQLLGKRVDEIDGCFTFEEYRVHLTAILSKKLRLCGITPDSALVVMSKQKTYEHLKGNRETTLYSPLSYLIQKEDDIPNAKEITFPAILKPENGATSSAITDVFSVEDCITKYSKLIHNPKCGDWGCSGFENTMVLMEFLPGINYTVDVVIFNGKLLKALLTDMGPKLPPIFGDTTTCFPSCLPKNLQMQLITASFQCCKAVGLQNGVFNVEMNLKNSCFKLVEINGRAGSYRRSLVFRNTDHVDVLLVQALISCGIKPVFPDFQHSYAVGCYLYPPIHGKTLSDPKFLSKITSLCEANEILYIKRTPEMGKDTSKLKLFSHLVALDKTSILSAKQKLIGIFQEFEMSTNDFDIEQLTKDFF